MNYLTVKQVAQQQMRSEEYIRKLIRDGHIPATKVSGRFMINPNDINIARRYPRRSIIHKQRMWLFEFWSRWFA